MTRWTAFWSTTALAAVLATSAIAEEVVVLSSYPEEMTAQFERAFAAAHPEHRMRLVWQQGREAMATMSKPDHGSVDVYWAPAAYNFPTLAKAGAFGPMKVDRTQVPGKIGKEPISDAKGRYEAFEVAGYGFAINSDALAKRGLPVPKTWDDLASPAFEGAVTMPVPSRIGFAPQLYDIILQKKGWTAGWGLLSEMSVNAKLAERGPGVMGPVVDGQTAVALGIDFLIRTAIATGKPIKLVYPNGTAFLPAHVAIVEKTPHPAAAQAFVDFVLSADGQKILFHPDVSRYPIRADVYAAAPEGTVNPFALGADATFPYDHDVGPLRAPLIQAVFDAAIAGRAESVRGLWAAIHAAEKDPKKAANAKKARVLAGWVPVTDAQAVDPTYLAQFEGGRGDKVLPPVAATWAAQLEAKRNEAMALVSSTK